MTKLKYLSKDGLHLVDKEFKQREKKIDEDELSKYIESPEFSVEIDRIESQVKRVMDEYGREDEEMDKELAPVVHQELDLTRRQASDPRIWNYLSIAVMPDFVEQRWTADADNIRWVASSRKQVLNRQAFSSLWWTAEATYTPDKEYEFTKKVFEAQEFKNWLMGPAYGKSDKVINALIATLHDMKSGDYRRVLREFTALTATYSVDSMSERELRELARKLRQRNAEGKKGKEDTTGGITDKINNISFLRW